MTVATTVLFRGIAISDALEAAIREHADALQRFAGDIHSCKVVVSKAGQQHRHGALYRISIHLALKRREIDVGEFAGHDERHADPYVAVADAFDAARRCVEDRARRRRDDVKRLPPSDADSVE